MMGHCWAGEAVVAEDEGRTEQRCFDGGSLVESEWARHRHRAAAAAAERRPSDDRSSAQAEVVCDWSGVAAGAAAGRGRHRERAAEHRLERSPSARAEGAEEGEEEAAGSGRTAVGPSD